MLIVSIPRRIVNHPRLIPQKADGSAVRFRVFSVHIQLLAGLLGLPQAGGSLSEILRRHAFQGIRDDVEQNVLQLLVIHIHIPTCKKSTVIYYIL